MAKQAIKKAAPRRTQQKHYRNIRYTPANFRLKELGRRVELAPRGQRGDIVPIKKGEQGDPDFIANKDLIFEVITDEEAKEVIAKQSTNQQGGRQRHPSLDILRSETGKEYADDAIKLDSSTNEDKGRVVAYTREVAEGVGDVIIDRDVGIRRAEVPGSADYNLPNVPDSVSPEEQAAYLADAKAKQAESVEDLGLKVTKGDTQAS